MALLHSLQIYITCSYKKKEPAKPHALPAELVTAKGMLPPPQGDRGLDPLGFEGGGLFCLVVDSYLGPDVLIDTGFYSYSSG